MPMTKMATIFLIFASYGVLIQPTSSQAMNSVVDARGGASQMPNEKCRRESAGNNDSERTARYEQCMAQRKKEKRHRSR
jgi:hypothetical protein